MNIVIVLQLLDLKSNSITITGIVIQLHVFQLLNNTDCFRYVAQLTVLCYIDKAISVVQ